MSRAQMSRAQIATRWLALVPVVTPFAQGYTDGSERGPRLMHNRIEYAEAHYGADRDARRAYLDGWLLALAEAAMVQS